MNKPIYLRGEADRCPKDSCPIFPWKCGQCKYSGMTWITDRPPKRPRFTIKCNYHKWKDPRTIEFGKRVPPTAGSGSQPGNEDIHWAAVAVWGKEAQH